MANEITLVPYSPKLHQGIIKLLNSRSSNAFDSIDLAHYEERFRAIKDQSDDPIFALVAVEGDKVIGNILVEEQTDSLSYFEVVCLSVDEDYRHQGLGSTLLTAAEKEMKKRGAKFAFLKTFHIAANSKVEKFYEKHGYHREEILKDYYVSGSSRHRHFDDCAVYFKQL